MDRYRFAKVTELVQMEEWIAPAARLSSRVCSIFFSVDAPPWPYSVPAPSLVPPFEQEFLSGGKCAAFAALRCFLKFNRDNLVFTGVLNAKALPDTND